MTGGQNGSIRRTYTRHVSGRENGEWGSDEWSVNRTRWRLVWENRSSFFADLRVGELID